MTLNNSLNNTQKVLVMFNTGLTPSEIDKRLGFIKGTARSLIVGAWSYDKEKAKLDRLDFEKAN